MTWFDPVIDTVITVLLIILGTLCLLSILGIDLSNMVIVDGNNLTIFENTSKPVTTVTPVPVTTNIQFFNNTTWEVRPTPYPTTFYLVVGGGGAGAYCNSCK